MTQKKRSLLPKFEVLIIFVFFISFILWAMSKCNKTQEDLQDDPAETTSTNTDENLPDSLTVDLPTQAGSEVNPITNPAATTATTPTPATTPRSNYAPLFVTIDGLNMREEPELNSEVIMKLKLFEQVNFMGEVTDSTSEVNLGYEIANEPWVKVQHARGKVGWVYGAGVNYYKKKREGVLE